ncbi:hypothetical protein RB653_000207 [Dictyostelium firmibasis]|uniref:EGF-like domain-containing protein n=1 Tax=Dictyostelium firmibasis TaxID=79012 RepID=A0AAN7TUS5_9MYCE
MKYNIFIYFILLFSTFFIPFSNSQTTQEYDCFYNIVTKFKLYNNFPKNSTGGYNFCNVAGTSQTMCTNGFITYALISSSLDFPPIDANLTLNDITCLPYLNVLFLHEIRVAEEVLFTKIGSVTQFTWIFSGSIGKLKFEKPLPSYLTYAIVNGDFNNSIVYTSYLNDIFSFSIEVSYVTFVVDPGTNGTKLRSIQATALNIPDLSVYPPFQNLILTFRSDYDRSSLVNYANIKSNKVYIIFPSNDTPIPSFIENNRNVTDIKLLGVNFEKPSGLIDISSNYSLKYLEFAFTDSNFNVNQEFPLILSKNIERLVVSKGDFKTVPSFSNSTQGTIKFNNCWAKDLSFYNGTAMFLDFSGNNLTGTIDRSYCAVDLNVANNNLTGEIPTCFTCYFGSIIGPKSQYNIPYANRFIGNNFTNYQSVSSGCPTFAPQARLMPDFTGFIISGTDIGFDTYYWRLNNTNSCTDSIYYSGLREIGCVIGFNAFKGVKYANINFSYVKKNYTFAFVKSPPEATYVKVSSNDLSIQGKYFSSYPGQSIQSITVSGVVCTESVSDFFNIICSVSTGILTSNKDLLTITTSKQTKRYYINTSDGYINSIPCPNDCTNNSRGICDLSTGFCACENGYEGNDCSEIICPSYNSLICNGSPNTCNSVTGVCNCSGRNFGPVCSSVQCFIPNCSGFGTCNTTIGECICDPSRQGINCSLPFIKCPTFNSLECNGVSNTCNNQTGICTCDSSHQSSDCSLPFVQCPTYNTLTCNGGLNTCNNQTGVCTCDSSHQSSDCSLPFAPCPIYNSLTCSGGLNTCDNQTGVCTCDSSHQGFDCSLPFIQCSNNCTGNGVCDTTKGICQCTPGKFTGEDCSIIYHYVNSVKSSTTKGGLASFYGVFGNAHNDLSVKIGGLDCKIESVTQDQIDCIAPAGTGVKSINVTQNGVNYFRNNFYKYEVVNTVLPCPKDCSGANNGICNSTTGQCTCINGYGSYDCSDISNNNNNTNNNNGGSSSDSDLPPTVIIIDPGKTNITNGDTNFLIYIRSISEVDFNGNIIKSFTLNSTWDKANSTDSNIYMYKQILDNTNCTVESKIEEVTDSKGKVFSFADVDFKVESGSVKFSISVSNYTYVSNLNNLQIELVSETSQSVEDSNKCNEVNTSLDTSDFNSESNLNYIKISKNNKVLSGRFINKVVSDGKVTFLDSIATKSTSDSISITLNLPHCTSECLIDPDFSVLLSSDFKSECGEKDDKNTYVIPVAVIGSVAGVAAIVTYPKNATNGYDVCRLRGITCSNNVVIVIDISAFGNYPPTSAIITPNELLCLPNLVSLKLDNLRVSTDVLFTQFGSVTSLTLQNIPKDAIDINVINRPFPTYYYYFLSCSEFNNTVLNSSYLNNVENFYIQSSFVNLNIDAGTKFSGLKLIYLWTASIPDLSKYTSLSAVYLTIRGDYDRATFTNYAKIKASTLSLTFINVPPTQSFIESNTLSSFVTISGQKFTKPTGIIDLSTGYALRKLYLYSPGTDFNVSGELPFKFSSLVTDIYINTGSFKTAPINAASNSIIVTFSGLTTLPYYNGTAKQLDFSNNALTGTIDRSYCNSELVVSNNQLSGTIPSCFTCYFGYPIGKLGSQLQTPFFNRFSGNAFSNYVQPQGCPTFAPQARAAPDNSGYIVSGTDIGFDTSTWFINDTITCLGYTYAPGKEMNCMPTTGSIKGIKYASINFAFLKKNYTFAFISSPPDASKVTVTGNTLTIEGKYFSSYLGQSVQSVMVGSVDCSVGSTDFYKIICTTVSTIPSSASNSQLLTISTANETKKFYIQTSNNYVNSIVCPNDCSTNSRGICDLSKGLCICNSGYEGIDCSEIPCPTFNSLPCNGSPNTCNIKTGVCTCSGSNYGPDCSLIQCLDPSCSGFGNCNTSSGQCKCDSSHQGIVCSLPFKNCPIYSSLTCNGGLNTCNNQTGICTCDSSHQGSDCSKPFIQCPSYNSLACNGGLNTCNNQTGICTCDSSHQGSDCSKPLIQCPVYNSLTCNGGLNTCNNQTGICSCDSSHQGSDCSKPLIQCPVYNSLACNGGLNTCNNQTGICSCDSAHQGSDCSKPLIQCPTYNALTCNGGLNTCNNQTGVCSCDSSHQGSDCSKPLIQCPVYSSLTCNGGLNTCNNQTGICTCDSSHQGIDCSKPLIQCPVYNSLTCNGGLNTCNNQTGICSCDSSHQGSDCSKPLIQCPIYNSLACNGGLNTCNNQTGICSCDSSHQGSDCSKPLIQCPTYNALTCNGGLNTCNNQTGVCTCDSSHQGSDCSKPLIQCPTYSSLACNGGLNTCNNQTGICTCDSSHQGSDCSKPLIQCPVYNSLACNGGLNSCNNQTGVCTCDSSYQGSDCSKPLIQCPTYNSLACNGGLNTCDNQTGICSCDSAYQGNDCSLPYIPCPTFNSLECNGGTNSCNNQTGVCTCDSTYQGNDCSLPYIPCPTYNSLECNGGSNSCNNQTGVCTCDSQKAGVDCSGTQCSNPNCSGFGTCNITTGKCDCDPTHQGSECSLPLIECPTSNTLTCNGGLNSCNNQTGVCTCDSSHQSSDCSLPFAPCPIYNSLACSGGLNTCDNQTGVCTCDSSHQGFDCSLPFIQCSNNCNGNGVCDTIKGICQCTPGKFTGEDCSIIYHYVNSVKSSTTKGGLASFYGVFGNAHNDLSVKIGGLDCKIESVTQDQIDCIAPAGTGVKSINVTQNGVNYFRNNFYKYEVVNTVLPCPKDCSGANKGICNSTTGQCTCINGYGSYDCSELSQNNNNGGSSSDSDLPTNVIVVDPGKTNITNGETNFLISIGSISEVDFNGNVIKTFKLNNIWEIVDSNDSNIYVYKQTLENTNCIVESKIEEVTDSKGKVFSFADVDFKVESGSVKFSISVSNYTYVSNLNNLQIELVSETSQSVEDSNKCNEVNTSLDTSDFNSESNLNYIKISKNNKVLSGRFINKVVSDGKVTFLDSIATKSTSDSISITLNLPHCTSECLIDPDFSVLLSSDFKSECGEKDDKKSYVIPVAVVGSVAGAAAIGASGFILYKKKFIENPLKKKLTRSQ